MITPYLSLYFLRYEHMNTVGLTTRARSHTINKSQSLQLLILVPGAFCLWKGATSRTESDHNMGCTTSAEMALQVISQTMSTSIKRVRGKAWFNF